jgi:serine/threonine protein kinase
MGEVYKATDTRLDRTVAIKILPSRGAGRPEARQRFEREAKAVSSLSHPHICALYDVGREDGIDYLVMEYLEGETLQARLGKGPLPVGEVLRYGVQIAEALAQAHWQGVSHRDLKPGNIILTKKGAKLLDFGLAKLREPVTNADGATLTAVPNELTKEGTILGTFQYMSPEQLEGKEADSRSDIFAFGAVLYEMATGRKAFEGKSQASLIGAIMSSEPPPVSSLQRMSPPLLDHVVKKCLAKDPDNRWQSAQDLASELKWIAEGSGVANTAAFSQTDLALHPSRPTSLPWIWMGLAGASTLAAVFLAIALFREVPPKSTAIRFTISPPEKTNFGIVDFATLSPDGERLAFTAMDADGKHLLYMRPLDSLVSQPLPGTERAIMPFWSPDSRYIAFFSGGKLKKIDAQGGASDNVVRCAAGPARSLESRWCHPVPSQRWPPISSQRCRRRG